MPYRVLFRPSAERGLRGLSTDLQDRVIAEIHTLTEDPRPPGAIKLAGSENLYRVRVGDYRVVYAIEDDFLVVLIVEIAHRREVYRKPDKKLTRNSLREFIKNKLE